MGIIATQLAQIAAATSNDILAGLPSEFAPVSAPGLPNGVYLNDNAAASVTTGVLNGEQVLVLAFRGSDDRQDWLNNLRNINTDYADLANVVAFVDSYAAQNDLPVVVIGHSLGGALTQVFMSQHPAGGEVNYRAVTFGSPGALITSEPDARITNYEISDDPIPYLGQYRAAISDQAEADPIYAAELVTFATAVGRGLTPAEAYASIPFFTTNYVNRGETDLLLGSSGQFEPYSASDVLTRGSFLRAAQEDAGRHDITAYLAEVVSAEDPEAFTGPETDVFRFSNPVTGGHFYTASEPERDQVIGFLEDFRYEGEAFDTTATEQTGTEVFRFYNTTTGAHFYTASDAERLFVDDAFPQFTFEGVAYYAWDDAAGGAHAPVHRFYNTAKNTHFYTASEEERQVYDTLPTHLYEGVAYYVDRPDQNNVPPVDTTSPDMTALIDVLPQYATFLL
jgi:pimeloyl-ACP methyl ester carboxylesterase